jgi:hypothetical protein
VAPGVLEAQSEGSHIPSLSPSSKPLKQLVSHFLLSRFSLQFSPHGKDPWEFGTRSVQPFKRHFPPSILYKFEKVQYSLQELSESNTQFSPHGEGKFIFGVLALHPVASPSTHSFVLFKYIHLGPQT